MKMIEIPWYQKDKRNSDKKDRDQVSHLINFIFHTSSWTNPSRSYFRCRSKRIQAIKTKFWLDLTKVSKDPREKVEFRQSNVPFSDQKIFFACIRFLSRFFPTIFEEDHLRILAYKGIGKVHVSLNGQFLSCFLCFFIRMFLFVWNNAEISMLKRSGLNFDTISQKRLIICRCIK